MGRDPEAEEQFDHIVYALRAKVPEIGAFALISLTSSQKDDSPQLRELASATVS